MLSKETIKQYNKLVRRANDRLRALEKLSQKSGYQAVTKYAYNVAVSDIRNINLIPLSNKKPSSTRYRRVNPNKEKLRPDELSAMRRTIKSIERFLESPSSTKKGIDKIYKERVEKWNKDIYGESDAEGGLSTRDFADIFESGLWEMLNQYYGSTTAQNLVGLINDRKDELKKLKKQGKKLRVSEQTLDDKLLNDVLGQSRGNVRILSKYLQSI